MVELARSRGMGAVTAKGFLSADVLGPEFAMSVNPRIR
jgi:hypothetical protein